MIVNFKIEDNYALIYEEQHIDLHNNFNFTCYNYLIAERQLTLVWTKSKGDWISESELFKLTIVHYNVSFMRIDYDNKEYQYLDDDKCLSNLSFFPSSDRQSNDSIISQDTPTDEDDIIYLFETGYFIRIGCGKIVLKVN